MLLEKDVISTNTPGCITGSRYYNISILHLKIAYGDVRKPSCQDP